MADLESLEADRRAEQHRDTMNAFWNRNPEFAPDYGCWDCGGDDRWPCRNCDPDGYAKFVAEENLRERLYKQERHNRLAWHFAATGETKLPEPEWLDDDIPF